MNLEETIEALDKEIEFFIHHFGVEGQAAREALGYLRDYQSLLSDMSAKGIKMVILGPKQHIISASGTAPVLPHSVSEVTREKEDLFVCECGQKVEPWHVYCYQCGKKLDWEGV